MVVVGMDEVGRGCWAGPLVAAAIILNKPVDGLRDSKKLTRPRREKLAKEIYNNGSVGIGWVEPSIVDEVGLTKATTIAMQEALNMLSVSEDIKIIMDGNINFLPHDERVECMIKADDKVPEVSAASIVAKVARDKFMCDQSYIYPHGFDLHVGYGTKLHKEMLKLHGICELHRKSFKPVREFL